ncbi:hypothetical protein FB45DRAFT_254049 [Roridomyces roridus]|uniref:Uncharacterized protein n=1 Tax=Roridomyces roridus TaxID=1738132 RepID=A0AAD7B9Q4_9AGAR|nr:hypothetical protein FB45DRAFT_254049 [Roridomyces roridus]
MACVGRFHRDANSETIELITSTPFFWATLVKAWSLLTQVEDPRDRPIMLSGIVEFAADAEVSEHPERLQEMVDEAGGSIDDLACLVINYIHTVLKNGTHTHDNMIYINRLLLFINDVDGHTYETGDQGPLGRLTFRLADQGFFPKLISAVPAFCELVEPEVERIVSQCIKSVTRIVHHFGPSQWLAELLDHAFLRVLLLVARNCVSRGWKSNGRVDFFMETAIPSGMVYYLPLVALRAALPLVKDVVDQPVFKRSAKLSAMWDKWRVPPRT